MRCRHVRERILESLLAGEPSLPEGIKPHLEQCEACRLEERLLRRGVEALQHIPVVDPPPDLKARTMERIRNDQYKETAWTLFTEALRARTPAFAAAALLVIVATVGFVWAVSFRGPDEYLSEVLAIERNQDALVQDIEWLEAQEWVYTSDRYTRTLDEAKQVIEEVANAKDNPEEVQFIVRRIRATRLIDELEWVAEAAPESDRPMVERLRLELEQLVRALPD